MSGITPTLPLNVDNIDGHYRLIKDYGSLVKQNFKNLILTSPGERIMMPHFGVGIRNFLFENDDTHLRERIKGKITEQAEKYLPFIQILSINIVSGINQTWGNDNTLSIQLRYMVIPLDLLDDLEITT